MGCVFLLLVLGAVLVFPHATPQQLGVMKTIQALGGASFSMSLSGFLTVKLNLPGKGYVVAGGTLAVFVILFFFPPPVYDIRGNDNIIVNTTKGNVSVGSAGGMSTTR